MTQQEIIETEDCKNLIPSMNVTATPVKQDESNNLVSDEMVLGMYKEIIDKIQSERGELDGYIAKFAAMVIDDGDATTSSKEALVNLIKIKADTSDKMIKLADLITRVKLKDRDTFPRYLAAHQNNTINIGNDTTAKKALLSAIKKAQKKQKEKDENDT